MHEECRSFGSEFRYPAEQEHLKNIINYHVSSLIANSLIIIVDLRANSSRSAIDVQAGVDLNASTVFEDGVFLAAFALERSQRVEAVCFSARFVQFALI